MLVACGTPTGSSPTIASFTSDPSTLSAPGTVKLGWSVSNASTVSIDNGLGAVTGNSKDVNVSATTTFTLTATGPGGTSTKQTTVTVGSPSVLLTSPTITAFRADPETLTSAGDVTLTWDVTGADSLSISELGGVSPVDKGSKKTSVTATKTFVLTATNAGGSSTRTVDVTVGTISLKPGTWNSSNWNEATWQ